MLLRGLKWLVTPWLLSDSGAAQANKALPEGKWEEFAGQCGQSGASNGLRDKATFDHPKGMCLTGAGQLIIVDSMNACIRSIDLESGMVSTLAGECGVKGAEDGPADEARFSTGITSAWCTPEGPIAIADASVRWIGAAGSFPVTPMPRPQPDPHPQPGPSKPSDQPTGAASWWGVVLWVLLGSIAGAGATAGWRTDCSAGHLRDLLSSRGSLSGPSHHQETRNNPRPTTPSWLQSVVGSALLLPRLQHLKACFLALVRPGLACFGNAPALLHPAFRCLPARPQGSIHDAGFTNSNEEMRSGALRMRQQPKAPITSMLLPAKDQAQESCRQLHMTKQAPDSEASHQQSQSNSEMDLISLSSEAEAMNQSKPSETVPASKWYGFEDDLKTDHFLGYMGAEDGSAADPSMDKPAEGVSPMQRQGCSKRPTSGNLPSIDDLLSLGDSSSDHVNSMAKDLIQF
ncbi:hypothetical protein WJX74_002508 [Apatococcus lobatus]|uniref:Uncharacterized protein n=1 Tax=Apatococcus lobatus TaxID=904363 RepID=A0AAW1RDD9_9CHLO